jgi:hypothetical protein
MKPETDIDRASATILRFPRADGDSFAARVEIHFKTGETLDISFSAKLRSNDGPCPGGGLP